MRLIRRGVSFLKYRQSRFAGVGTRRTFSEKVYVKRIVLARLDVFEAEALRWEPASPFPASLVQWTGTMSKSVEL